MIFRYDRKMVALGLIFLGLCLGCNGGNDAGRNTLSGKVTFGGKPVPYGLIYFSPDITQGNSGPQGYAEIVNGEYSTDDVGMGAVMGPLVVQISGFPQGKDESGAFEGTPLFPRYKTSINLTEGMKTMDFDVPSNLAFSRNRQRQPQ